MKNKLQKQVDMPIQIRSVDLERNSVDAEKMTADVVFSTGSRVRRFSFFSEDFIEELSLDPKDIRLGRLNTGAPFLRQHNQSSLDAVLGKIVEGSAQTDGKKATAKVQFSNREDVQPVFQDIKDGIIKNVSVGYRVHKFQDMGEDKKTGLKIMRAVDWEPFEVSAVAIGADNGAKIREDLSGLEANSCEIILNETKNQPEEPVDPTGNDPESLHKEVDQTETVRQDEIHSNTGENKMLTDEEKKALKKEAQADERKRQADIAEAVQKAGLNIDFARQLQDQDINIDEARTAIIEKLAEENTKPEVETRTVNPDIQVTSERIDVVKRGIENALDHKASKGQTKLVDEATEFRHMSLLDMARDVLDAQGVKTRGLSRSQLADIALNNKIVGRAGSHSTSDFPLILANVANKTLRRAYDSAPATWRPFTNETTAPDFKPIQRTQLGESEQLEKVPEGGEIKKGTISEGAEVYSLATYAKRYAFTRQMLINDDMSAFSRMPAILGRRVADLENLLVWSIITANANLADGNPLFGSAHANLGTGAAPSETTLTEMRQLMRSKVGLDGQKLNLVPTWIYVPQSLETVAEKLVATVVPSGPSSVSAFSGSGRTPLQLGVEPLLEDNSATAWYGFASIGQVDMIELSRLEGEAGPVIESRDGFEVEGMEIKVRHDAAAKALDHRGMFKNAGV